MTYKRFYNPDLDGELQIDFSGYLWESSYDINGFLTLVIDRIMTQELHNQLLLLGQFQDLMVDISIRAKRGQGHKPQSPRLTIEGGG